MKFENFVATPPMESIILEFHCRYVEDKLILVEEDQEHTQAAWIRQLYSRAH